MITFCSLYLLKWYIFIDFLILNNLTIMRNPTYSIYLYLYICVFIYFNMLINCLHLFSLVFLMCVPRRYWFVILFYTVLFLFGIKIICASYNELSSLPTFSTFWNVFKIWQNNCMDFESPVKGHFYMYSIFQCLLVHIGFGHL